MFIPLRDENPSGKFPFANIGLIVANALVFIYQLTLGPHAFQTLVLQWGTVPARIGAWFAGHGSFEYAFLPLVASMFLHSGVLHVLGNLLFLWIFGDNVEAQFGHLQYLIFYFFTGIGAGLLHVAFNIHSHIPAIGASGAISGVMGAYIVLEPTNRILTWTFFIFLLRVPAAIFLGIWFGMQFLSGLNGRAAAINGGVAVWAHIGGFLLGVLIAFIARKR
jgi:membrane associated rhomboid family serine protease